MGRRIVIELTTREAERLARGDWHISLGHGVRVPQSLQRAQERIRQAASDNDSEQRDGSPRPDQYSTGAAR